MDRHLATLLALLLVHLPPFAVAWASTPTGATGGTGAKGYKGVVKYGVGRERGKPQKRVRATTSRGAPSRVTGVDPASLPKGNRVVRPRFLSGVLPTLPPGRVGAPTVSLRLEISAEGRVTAARPVHAVEPALTALAVAAAKGFRFRPASLNGKPTPCVVLFSVHFIKRSSTTGERSGQPNRSGERAAEQRGSSREPSKGRGSQRQRAGAGSALGQGGGTTHPRGEKPQARGTPIRSQGPREAGAGEHAAERATGQVKVETRGQTRSRKEGTTHATSQGRGGALAKKGPTVQGKPTSKGAYKESAKGEKGEPLYVTTIVERRPLTAASDRHVRDQDFLLFPRKTASDLLLMVPQLHISQHSGSGKGHQIFLRGFDAEHGQDIHISYAGVPLNQPSHVHGIGYTDLHFLLPGLIQRIEILKGPYDVRYGNFATAGAINFVMRSSLPRPSLALEVGSFDTYKFTRLRELKGDGFTFVGGGQLFATEGFTHNGRWRGVKTLGRVERWVGGTLLRSTFGFYTSAWHASDALPERLVESGEVDFYGGLDHSDGGSAGLGLLSFSVRRERPGSAFMGQLYLLRQTTHLFTNYTYFTAHPEQGDQTEQGDRRVAVGGRVERKREWRGRWGRFALLSGVDLRVDALEMELYRTKERVRWDRGLSIKGDVADLGAYLSATYTPARWFRAVVGARGEYLWYSGSGVQDLSTPSGALQHDTPLSSAGERVVLLPKVSLVFSPGPSFSLFLNTGAGFHSPDMRDVLGNEEATIPLAWGGELGARLRYGRINLAGSLWGIALEQELFFDPTLGRSVNQGSSQRRGAELEARLRLFRWLHLFFDSSYTEAFLTESGEPVPNAPKVLLRGGGIFRHRLEGPWEWCRGSLFSLGVRYQHIGRRDLAMGKKSQRANVVDLLARWRFARFALEFAAVNLLNTRWRDAQFYYVSRATLQEPDTGIAGHHFTAGTPLALSVNLKLFY